MKRCGSLTLTPQLQRARLPRALQLLPLIGAMALAACTTTPQDHAQLQQARAQYNVLQAMPESQRYATRELAAAEQSLRRAEESLGSGDRATVDHLAHVATQQVGIAEHTYRLRQAEAELERSGETRTQVQLQARTAQAQAAEQRALTAQQRAEQAQQRSAELEQELKDLAAEQTNRGTVVTLGDVLFDLDKAELNPGGERNLQQLGEFLVDNADRKVLIEGFTDSTGADEYNRQLSERRANAVRDALVSHGVDVTRIQTRGYGEQYPVASNDSAAQRQLNRRVEVIISDDAQAVVERRR